MNMPGKRYRELTIEKSVVRMHVSTFSIHKLHTINSDYILNTSSLIVTDSALCKTATLLGLLHPEDGYLPIKKA